MISAQTPHLKGTIFIVTYGRSGSTLLQSLLQTMVGAQINGENGGALEGLFHASKAAHLARETWGRKPHPAAHPWRGAHRIDPDRFEQRLVEVFTQEILHPPPAARWIGFKEIRYHRLGDDFPVFLQFCRRNFHNAFFVFNSRRGEKVAKSKWWANQPEKKVLQLVARMDTHFAAFAVANPRISHHVFYEETIADPTSLVPLFEKLGETLDLDKMQSILSNPLTH